MRARLTIDHADGTASVDSHDPRGIADVAKLLTEISEGWGDDRAVPIPSGGVFTVIRLGDIDRIDLEVTR